MENKQTNKQTTRILSVIEINKGLLQGFLFREKMCIWESWFLSENEYVSCHHCSTGDSFKLPLGNGELLMSPLHNREFISIHSVSTDKENFVDLAWFPACELPQGSWSLNFLVCKLSNVTTARLRTACVILEAVLRTKQKLVFSSNWKVYYILLI